MQMVKKTIGSNMRRVLFSSALLLVSSLTLHRVMSVVP